MLRYGLLLVPAIVVAAIYGCTSDDPPATATPDAGPECTTDIECRRNLRGNGWLCRAGACACPETAGACGLGVGGGCLDLRADPENCGACGNICPSDTTCVDSACRCGVEGAGGACKKPDAAVGTQCVGEDCRNVWRLATEAGQMGIGKNDVFFTMTGSKIQRAPKDGNEPFSLFIQLPVIVNTGIRLLTSNATHVAWEKGGMISTCLQTGCTPADLAPSIDGRALRLSATDAYWFDPASKTIVRCALAGCNGTPAILATRAEPSDAGADADDAGDAGASPALVVRLAIGGDGVYVAYDDGLIAHVPPNGGALETLVAPNGALPTSLAVDQERIYWTDAAGLHARAKTGGVVTLVAGPPAAGVVADGKKIYWASGANPARIAECPREGCPAEGPVLGLETFRFESLEDDADSIYILETAGIILRGSK